MKKQKGCPYFYTQNFLLISYLNIVDAFSKIVSKSIKIRKNDEEIKKILVVQLAHIGDVVLTTAILNPIQEKYRDSKIDFLVGSWSKEIPLNISGINKIYVLNHFKNNRKRSTVLYKIISYFFQFFSVLLKLKKEKYDLSIDLNLFYPNANFLTFFAKISKRIGFTNSGSYYLLSNSHSWSGNSQHATTSYMDLISKLQIPIEKRDFYSPRSIKLIENILVKGKSYIVFHPFTGDPSKNWPLVNWIELLKMFETKGLTVIFTGKGKLERLSIESITRNSSIAVNLANKLSIVELQSVIAKSSLLICSDTMVGHLASTLTLPILSIFSKKTNPINWRPPTTRGFVLSEFPNTQKIDGIKTTDMISPEMVFEKAINLLQIRTSF